MKTITFLGNLLDFLVINTLIFIKELWWVVLIPVILFFILFGPIESHAKETERVIKMRKTLSFKVLFFCPKVFEIKTDKDIRAKQRCIIKHLMRGKK